MDKLLALLSSALELPQMQSLFLKRSCTWGALAWKQFALFSPSLCHKHSSVDQLWSSMPQAPGDGGGGGGLESEFNHVASDSTHDTYNETPIKALAPDLGGAS